MDQLSESVYGIPEGACHLPLVICHMPFSNIFPTCNTPSSPVGTPRFQMRIRPPYPQCRKRRLNGAVSRPCVGAWTGTLKNPTKCLWRWEPDRRYKFLLQSAATSMTEISFDCDIKQTTHLNPHTVIGSLYYVS